jgi:hypothetical protein
MLGFGDSVLAYVPNDRWTTTAAGPAGEEGDPVTLRWSLARDGTNIPGEGSSNLIAFLDDIFNVTSGGTNFAQKPWFSVLQQSFDRWSALSGITFVYEPNDSGGNFSSAAGLVGVRGDIRIGGQNIDGSGSTLAYAFFPNNGDIVIDTSELNFFSTSTNNYRSLRNTLMHEIGHTFGLDHVESSTDQLLMEPNITPSIDGPQLDEIRGVQGLYGDALEKTNSGQGNGSYALASSLGSLVEGGSLSIGSAAEGSQSVGPTETDFVSIANSDDIDFYSFSVSGPSTLSATLTPLGGIFNQAAEDEPQSPFNANARNDLALAIYNSNGTTLLASASTTAAGEIESLFDVHLTTAGQYFARITGALDAVQLYELELAALPFVPLLAGDYNSDGAVDAADYVVWRQTLGQVAANLAADGNRNGQVDIGDYTLWRSNFGQTTAVGTGAASTIHAIPEPASLLLLFMSTVAFTCVRIRFHFAPGSRTNL